MFYMNYLKKPINIVISLAVLVLGVLAIVFCFTNELFGCEVIRDSYKDPYITNLKYFDIKTSATSTFTFQGIIEFSTRLIENQNNTDFVNYFEITSSMVNGALALKILVIVLISCYGIFALSQLFDFRAYSSLGVSLVSFIILLVIKTVALKTFTEPYFINYTTDMLSTITWLWIIAFILSSIQVSYNLVLKYVKKAEK